MAFHVTDRQGAMYRDPSLDKIECVLNELNEIEDIEHPDIALTHESGWTLSAFPSGLLVWENVESEDLDFWHCRGVSRADVRRLWLLLADGDIEGVARVDWQPGYGADPGAR